MFKEMPRPLSQELRSDERLVVAICCQSQSLLEQAHRWALHKGHISLMVPYGDRYRIPNIMSSLKQGAVVSDAPDLAAELPRNVSVLEAESFVFPTEAPSLATDQVTTFLMTGGSTGKPKLVPKAGRSLLSEVTAVASYIRPSIGSGARVINTVPVEHMFGYMYAFWIPLLTYGAVGRRAFLPNDIRLEAESSEYPICLVTTPTHLKSCVDARIQIQNVSQIICATSRLSSSLASAAAECFGAPILESYGSTETGSMAFRTRAAGEVFAPPWELIPGAEIQCSGDQAFFMAPHIPGSEPLNDILEFTDKRSFNVVGRKGDMVKVCGKRQSLSVLNQLLLDCPSVMDGAFHFPEDRESHEDGRLVAFVSLKPEGSAADVMSFLRGKIDDVFLPRPVLVVPSIPRSDASKVRKEDLVQLYANVSVCR